MKTIFCDIDGVLLSQSPHYLNVVKGDMAESIIGSAAKILEWHCKGYTIILVTGRPESMRSTTIKNLERVGILYDQLIMSAGSAERILINDIDPEYPLVDKAKAINLIRQQGISGINI